MRMDKELITDRPSDWMPELHDIPIGLVNTILYHSQQADIIAQKYVIPNSNNNIHHHHYKNSNNSSILNNNISDAADEMSEEDALALRRRNNTDSNFSNGKRILKNKK
jgi:hypothetical protein